MAINKNFVIKNGVQVDTNLIVGDSTLKKVGIGTTVPQYTLHVHAADRGGIGVTDINVVGVATIANLDISGFSTFANDINVSGMVSAQAFAIGTTEVIDRGLRLSGIASLDSTTIATIESAIKAGPNIFDDLKILGLSTFVGVATFLGGIDVNVRSGVSTFSAPVQFGFAPTDGQAGLVSSFVAVGATVGFGTSVFFRDNAAIFMGDGSDLRLYHDNTNSYIDNMTGALYVRNSVDNDDNSSIILQAKSGENSIVMTNSADESNEVELYYDNSKKLQTTSGGLFVTGITTLSNRLHVQAGVSTFDADTRFGIGATVGFGTSAFFKDDAAIFLGDDSDLKVHHDGSNSYIQDVGTGDLILQGSADIKLQSASGENYLIGNDTGSVEVYYDNSKKLESTSGGLNVTGITTFSDRLYVTSGISTFQDSAKLTFGTQADLIVWHDGSHSYIQDTTGTGNLYVDSNNLVIRNAAGDETQATFVENGAVSLYYDNSKKLESTSGGLNVTGITTFSDRLNVVSGVSTFQDNAKLTFGAQGDLTIYHDATHSYIANATGDLYLQSGTSDPISLQSDDIRLYNRAGNEVLLRAYADGGVVSYYDNSIKLETTSGGLNVTGIATFSDRLYVASGISTFADNAQLTFGTQQDLKVHHNATNSAISNKTGSLLIEADALELRSYLGEEYIKCVEGAQVELYHHDVKKAETTLDGVVVGSLSSICVNGNAAFAGIVTIGGDLNVTGDIVYDEITGRNLNITGISTLQGQANFGGTLGIGATIFVNGNAAISGITTFGNRINVTSGISTFADNAKLTFGTQGDLAIYHDASNSYLTDSGTGSLIAAANQFEIKNAANSAIGLRFIESQAVELFYNGAGRIITTAEGVAVGTGVTIQTHGGVSIAGLTTASGGIRVAAGASIYSNGNATFSGITTFGGTSHIRLPNGSDAQRPGSPQAGDFRYNTDDGKFEGYTTGWGEIGGGGGVSQSSGIVSTTSTVGFAASFAHASFRSAHVNLLIVQGNTASDRTFMTGKYLMIHDGTTVTVVEQAAVSTGDMLGAVSGAIVGSNAELQVTMVSSGVATCSAKIDTMADSI